MASITARRKVLKMLACAASPWLASGALAAGEGEFQNGAATDGMEAGGFRILGVDPVPDAALQAIGRILDLGLPQSVVDFFRTVPIIVDAQLPARPGSYEMTRYGWAVRIRPDGLSPDKPVLLHELLHAYHQRVVGLGNAQIKEAYSRAFVLNEGDRRLYFISNDREFFAVTGTIFLMGKIQQPPFDCRALVGDQAYLDFLGSLFGKGQC